MNEVALNCSFFATDKIVADDLEKFFIQIIKELMIYRVFVLFFFHPSQTLFEFYVFAGRSLFLSDILTDFC